MKFYEDTIKALNDAQVRYIVVGGLAVILHGHIRHTYDLDLIIDLTPEEAHRAMAALTELGFRPKVPVKAEEFADPAARARWIEEKGMTVFSFWDPVDSSLIVDVFVGEPIPFEDLWSRSLVLPLKSTEVRVASIPDLIELKRRAGRHVDLTDIEVLEDMLRIQDEG
ncbi:MAG: DUF6036 family nucleotidyltransferase [Actinomycetota bacterium]